MSLHVFTLFSEGDGPACIAKKRTCFPKAASSSKSLVLSPDTATRLRLRRHCSWGKGRSPDRTHGNQRESIAKISYQLILFTTLRALRATG